MLCTRCGKPSGEISGLCNDCQVELQSMTATYRIDEDQNPSAVHSKSALNEVITEQDVAAVVAAAKEQEQFQDGFGDTLVGHELTRIEEKEALVWFRILALLIDAPLIAFTSVAATKLLHTAAGISITAPQFALPTAGSPIAIYLLNSGFETLFVVGLAYYLMFEVSPLRASPGKLLFELSPRFLNSERVSGFTALLRTFNKSVSFLPMLACITYVSQDPLNRDVGWIILGSASFCMFLVVVDFFAALITDRRQTVHDLMTRTVVMQPVSLTGTDVLLRTGFSVILTIIAGWGISLAKQQQAPATQNLTQIAATTTFSSSIGPTIPVREFTTTTLPALDKIPYGALGYAAAGENKVFFRDVIARYNTRYHNLEVALFHYKLSDKQKRRIRRMKAMTALTEGGPHLLLTFAFTHGSRKMTTTQLTSYTANFHRYALGSFHFPGLRDMVSFSRSPFKLGPREHIDVRASVSSGRSRIELSCGGRAQRNKNSSFVWSWNVKLKAPIYRVR